MLIINLVAGFLSDRLGRRTVLLLYGLIHVIASYVTAFTPSYSFYVVVR